MDVGLRAMDYLSSYSSLQQLQVREASGNGEDGTEDLSVASPYSMDEPGLAIMKRGQEASIRLFQAAPYLDGTCERF